MQFGQLKRREFIALIGGFAAWPIAATGQQSSIPVIGFINGSSARAYAAYVQAFLDGLGETGHVDGRNVAIEYRWAEGHYERIPEMVPSSLRTRPQHMRLSARQAISRWCFLPARTRSRAASSKA
jgi:putative ABC transport system substrate-binding protein